MFSLTLLGWDKGHNSEVVTDSHAEEPQIMVDKHLHDDIVNAVLESAEKKADDENVGSGEVFNLPLADIPAEPDEIAAVVDFDTDLPMKAGEHGLMFMATSEDDDSLQFQRL